MRVLVFLLSVKAKNFIRENSNVFRLIVTVLLTLATLSQACFLSLLLDKLVSEQPEVQVDSLIRFLLYFILGLPTLTLFFSAFRDKITLFKPYDPVSNVKQLAIELIYNFCSLIYILLGAGVLLIYFTSKSFTLHHTALAILALVNSSILRSFVQESLSNGRTHFYLRISLLLGALLTLFLLHHILAFESFLAIAGPFLLALALFIKTLYISSSRSPRSTSAPLWNLAAILIKVYFRNRPILFNFLLTIVVKMAFVFLFYAKLNENSPPVFEYFRYFVLSSSLWFTYIHNNIFGYLKTTYKSLAPLKSMELLFRAYLIMLGIPIIVDAAISLGLVSLYSSLNYSILGFYLSSLIINTFVGFYASLNSPIEIKTAFRFTGSTSNTPVHFSFITVLITALFSFLYGNLPPGYLMVLTGIVSIYLYYFLVLKSKTKVLTKDVFSKL